MNRYVVRQRLAGIGDDFDIKDAQGNKLYFVDGKALSFVDDLAVKDLKKNQLMRIKKRMMTFAPTYDIIQRQQTLATVRKSLFTFRHTYSIAVPSNEKFNIVGRLFRWEEYGIHRNGTEVAKVTKKLLSFSDSYAVDIRDGQDDLLLLCMAIVIDMTLHKKR